MAGAAWGQAAPEAAPPDGTPPDTAWTLQRAIEYAQAQSPAARSARLGFASAESRFEATQAQFLPGLALTGSAPGLERSIDDIVQDDGSVRYVEQNRLFSRGNLELEQVLPWTGTTLTVSSGLSRVDQFGDRQDFRAWQAAPVTVGLEQPLFQFNAYKWDRRLAPLDYRIARRTLDEDLEAVAVTTVRRYFDLYVAQIGREIAEFNVAVNDTIYTLSQGRFEIGKIAENELLQTELALLNAQNALGASEIALQESRQDLRRTLGLPSEAVVEVDPPTALPDIDVDPEAAVEQARRNRPDFLALRRERTAARREVAQAKSSSGFSATMVARYGLNQSAPSLNDAYRNPLDQQQLGVSFRVPLYRWGRGDAQVEAAKANRDRVRIDTEQQREALEQEVYFQALRLQQLRVQTETAAKADTVAQRRFEVARNRYTVGNISITDLFNAQREKDEARRTYVRTLRDFWIAYYELRRLTLREIE